MRFALFTDFFAIDEVDCYKQRAGTKIKSLVHRFSIKNTILQAPDLFFNTLDKSLERFD